MFTSICFCKVQGISFYRNPFITFPVIQTVNFFTAKSCHFHKTIRCSAKITQICIIYNSGPISQYQLTTISYISLCLLLEVGTKQIKHRCGYNLVTLQLLFHINYIHIKPLLTKCKIRFFYRFFIEQIFISWSCCILQSPAVFPVINHSYLRMCKASSHLF